MDTTIGDQNGAGSGAVSVGRNSKRPRCLSAVRHHLQRIEEPRLSEWCPTPPQWRCGSWAGSNATVKPEPCAAWGRFKPLQIAWFVAAAEAQTSALRDQLKAILAEALAR